MYILPSCIARRHLFRYCQLHHLAIRIFSFGTPLLVSKFARYVKKYIIFVGNFVLEHGNNKSLYLVHSPGMVMLLVFVLISRTEVLIPKVTYIGSWLPCHLRKLLDMPGSCMACHSRKLLDMHMVAGWLAIEVVYYIHRTKYEF